MHVTVVGAGALGVAYAGLLSLRGGVDVSLVARSPRAAGTVFLERVEKPERLEWVRPACVTTIPGHADCILIAVRYEQIDGFLAQKLAAESNAPIVVLTPMMPQRFRELADALPGRVAAAMPNVVSYFQKPDVLRHWLPRSATTLIDEWKSKPPALEALVNALNVAKIRSRFEMGVHEINPATTLLFLPLMMVLCVAGSIDALLADGDLLRLAFAAVDETRALAAKVGKPETWASMLLRFAGPRTVRMGIGLARGRSAEAVQYAEDHFGKKLGTQHLAMAEDVMALGIEKGIVLEAFRRLTQRLKQLDGSGERRGSA